MKKKFNKPSSRDKPSVIIYTVIIYSVAHRLNVYHREIVQSIENWAISILWITISRVYNGITQIDIYCIFSEERLDASFVWPGIETFTFNARLTIPYMETVRTVLNMFHELGFISRFNLDLNTLVQFSLTVKQGYRDSVPYHNWWHAFSVAHFFYLICKNSISNLPDRLTLESPTLNAI